MYSFTHRRQGRRRLMLIAAASAALLLGSPAVAQAANDDPNGEAATADQLRAAEAYAFPPGNWWDSSRSDTRRAAALLRQMTLEEKVDMLHGEINNFYGFYNA